MNSIHTLFIANRGEIALRIIRSCQRLGIRSVLGVSEADRHSLPAKMADQVILLGPAPASQSYLDVSRVAQAAVQSGADAVHPGYGFLSENAAFARDIRARGLIFIGPTEDQLAALGDKLSARQHAEQASMPVLPGGPISDEASARTRAAEVGYPVLVKAVGGGGGRGMKIFYDEASLDGSAVDLAMEEARKAFNDERLYLEAYVSEGRHVEVQVLGDGQDVIHLGTRDCSIQRRYQKLVEEAPAPSLPDDMREGLLQAAVRFAAHLDYEGAGTVEFLVDVQRQAFYFLEMNARIQVEHPVTEAITGIDLVAQQIRVAEGRRLGLRQDDIHFHGHALECRLNAEDIHAGFMPGPGTLDSLILPVDPALRIDTWLESGDSVSPYYDSLMAKFITHGESREAALAAMDRVLDGTTVSGVPTNLELHRRILATEDFSRGGVSTSFLPALLSAQETHKHG